MGNRCLISVLLALAAGVSLAQLPEVPQARVDVYPFDDLGAIDPGLVGINVGIGRKAQIANPAVVERVRALGFGSLRFPNGCEADRYDWKNAAVKGHVTVDEFLTFCDETGAQPYYCLNLQGGTEGLAGPPPPGAPVEMAIRYRHTAPNPCGNTDYHFGTLAEAVELVQRYTCERVLAGRRPIVYFEMGNENWGQSKSDWPPAVYAETVRAYAVAMRAAVDASAAIYPQLAGLRLDISAVGYPMTGNNQDPNETPDYGINVAWTRGLNRLYDDGLLDAVQEHFYIWGWGGGEELVWTVHNLENLLLARRNRPNPRLDGYHDPALAYRDGLGLDFTEWNARCWGEREQFDRGPANGEFEDGLEGWAADAVGAEVSADTAAARHGARGVRLHAGAGGTAEIATDVDVSGRATAMPSLWVWADRPEAVAVSLRQAPASATPGAPIGPLRRPKRVREWQHLLAGGDLPKDATRVTLAVSVGPGPVEARVDGVRCMTYGPGKNRRAPTADTYTQRLFGADVFRALLQHDTRITHYHHLFGNYGCTCFSDSGLPRHNAAIFEFVAGRVGDRRARAVTDATTYRLDTYWDQWASDFSGLVRSTSDVPVLSAAASTRDGTAFVLLVNRLTDRPVRVELRVHAQIAAPTAALRSLSGEDYNLDGAQVTDSECPIGPAFEHWVPAHTAQVLAIRFDPNVSPTPPLPDGVLQIP